MVVSAKTNVKRPVAVSVLEQKRLSAPVFLKGLRDLKVMDGSQVTMTVEVAGKTHCYLYNELFLLHIIRLFSQEVQSNSLILMNCFIMIRMAVDSESIRQE